MAFSDFKYPDVIRDLGLTEKPVTLFRGVPPVRAAELAERMRWESRLALTSNSEKARSEWMVAPVLAELWRRTGEDYINLHSGFEFDADPDAGLNGYCDFLIGRSPQLPHVAAPVAIIFEAKRDNIVAGFGQCIAGMVGVQRYNRREGVEVDPVYGCVTTGSLWRFFTLTGRVVGLDPTDYAISQLDQLLGILAFIVGPVPPRPPHPDAICYDGGTMKYLTDLFPVVADKVEPPVLVALGSPWPVTQIALALQGKEVECVQMDAHQADVLRSKLTENGASAVVHVAADLWDLPRTYKTVIFPAAAHSDRELKLDVIEQGFHVLDPGGLFVTLSEYEKDSQVAKWHKKVFGKCGESPRSKFGMAFWSRRDGDQPRRRHAVTFHARIGDAVSMSFQSWPGTFSFGRLDEGSRAMLEVAKVKPGDKVLDMGCGNGAVGCLVAPMAGPTGEVTFVDSSARAVKLAEENAKTNGVTTGKFVTTADLTSLGMSTFDVALANPPYFANSAVAQKFIQAGRDLVKPGGKFYFVTKMPVGTIPEIVETFGGVDTVENRGYTVIIATV